MAVLSRSYEATADPYEPQGCEPLRATRETRRRRSGWAARRRGDGSATGEVEGRCAVGVALSECATIVGATNADSVSETVVCVGYDGFGLEAARGMVAVPGGRVPGNAKGRSKTRARRLLDESLSWRGGFLSLSLSPLPPLLTSLTSLAHLLPSFYRGTCASLPLPLPSPSYFPYSSGTPSPLFL